MSWDRLVLELVRLGVIPLLGVVVAALTASRFDVVRWEARLEGRAGRLAAAAGLGCLTLFAGLLIARYLTWHSFVLDLGSYDQKIWIAATRPELSGLLEQTYRGGVEVQPCGTLRYWGICHFQPLYMGYALLYRLLSSPLILLVSQVGLVISGAVPCYLLARERLGSGLPGALAAALYLLHPAVQYNALLDFRPDHVAIPFTLWAYLLADRGHPVAAVAAMAVPALAKETLMLSFAGFGLFLAVGRRQRLLGAAVLAAGCAAFFLVSFLLLGSPQRAEGGLMVDLFFSGGPGFFDPLLLARKVVYFAVLLGGFGFLPLLSPWTLAPALPSLAISLLSSEATHASIQSQYSAAAIGPLFAGLLAVLARRSRQSGDRAMPGRILAGLVVVAVSLSVALGPTPWSLNFWSQTLGRQWHYTQYLPDRQAALDEAERLIPADPGVMVVTQNDLNSARLAHRHFYFVFPAGLERADYVFLDTRRMPFVYSVPKDRELYGDLVRRLRGSPEYRSVVDRDGVLLLARGGPRRPGPPDAAALPPMPRILLP